MTSWNEVETDNRYLPVLDKGFVGLVDIMGNDDAIAEAARLSYSKGTKKITNNEGLIRYLLRHKHTSPFEMVELKFHVKIPIFIARQLIRHRTSSINEASYRYSQIVDDFYIPDLENISVQSATNNQGRGSVLDQNNAILARNIIEDTSNYAFEQYKQLLGPEAFPEEDFTAFDENYNGIAREIARTVIPVNIYTEFVWKQDLHNLFHLLKLRMDSHAQYEIRMLANAMYELIKPYLPVAIRAFEDFSVNAINVAGTDKSLLDAIIAYSNSTSTGFYDSYEAVVGTFDDEAAMLKNFRLSKRELTEFKATWKLA